MHNPKLKHRLHRVRGAGAVRARRERRPRVRANISRAMRRCFRTRAVDTIADAGHAPQVEQPDGVRRQEVARFPRHAEPAVGVTTHESLAFQRERLSLSAAGRRIRIDPRQPAEPQLRPGEGRRALRPLPRRMADRRGRGHGDHAQRASPDGDLRRPGGAAGARRAGAAVEEGAAPDPRQSGRQPPPAGARRRGDGDGRRAFARPARMRLRARRALRGAARQQQPGAHERAPVGGDRPDRQGLDQPRRAVQPRGPLLPPPQRQHLAAALSAAASADLGRAPRARAAPRASARAAMCRRRSSPASRTRRRSSTPIARAGARPAAAATCRSTGSPMRRSSMPRRRRRRRTPAPRSCCGTSPPTRCRRTSPIRPATCRSPASVADAARRGARPARGVQGKRDGRGGDRGRHHVRRHARSGLSPVQDALRPCRRLRASADHGPGRLPRARRHGARHPHLRARGLSAPEGGVSRYRDLRSCGRSGSLLERPRACRLA